MAENNVGECLALAWKPFGHNYNKYILLTELGRSVWDSNLFGKYSRPFSCLPYWPDHIIGFCFLLVIAVYNRLLVGNIGLAACLLQL